MSLEQLYSYLSLCSELYLILLSYYLPLSRFEASSNTIDTITYTDWLTRTGEVSRDVDVMVTPNVIVSFYIRIE